MIRLIPLFPLCAAFVLIATGCSTPSKNPNDTYGSAQQQERMQEDTTMGPSMGGGWNAGQGYKGGDGLGAGRTADKF